MTPDEAGAELRAMLPPGSTAHTILRHVSRSGMSRVIDVAVCGEDGPRSIGWLVAQATERRYDSDRYGVKSHGCGMDMGFELVYALSRCLYPAGFECIGRDDERRHYCPSNDHSNGDRDYTPHHHTSGGYAISHRWL